MGYHGPRNTKEEEEETMAHYVTGPAIKALRERKGLTQKQLAEQILVSDKAVSKWETGKGLPDLSLLEPLAKALGVSVAELLSGEYRQSGRQSAAQSVVCLSCLRQCGLCPGAGEFSLLWGGASAGGSGGGGRGARHHLGAGGG